MRAKYICIEGTEGAGKTTQTQKLVDYLKQDNLVLQTKEPGTILSPLTMEMRNLMLNAKYDVEMTPFAREVISQAIRSVHIKNVIGPAIKTYDYIIQDRGVLSGLAYGTACGNDPQWLEDLAYGAVGEKFDNPYLMYDKVIYLYSGDVAGKLEIAKSSKQEFEDGDAMELRGKEFMLDVQHNFDKFSEWFNTVRIDVDGKGIDEVFDEVLHHVNSPRGS
jgi:dTMP kinase